MVRYPNAPRLVFETSIPSLPGPRAFWGTLCGVVGQTLKFTETSAKETRRRERLETERKWRKILAPMRHEMGWTATQIRRFSTAAGQASEGRLLAAMHGTDAHYEVAKRAGTPEEDELEMRIEESLSEHIFDMLTDNGIRDRKIVIEAMLGGHDILATNNTNSIDHNWLAEWIDTGPGKALGITTAVLSPRSAESRVRAACQQPPEWVVEVAAQSCVTQPDDREQASREIYLLIEDFHKRGMGTIQHRIFRVLDDERTLEKTLESVRRHGLSLAGRTEASRENATVTAVAKAAKVPQQTLRQRMR